MPDIQSIINQMTLEEKAAMCTGASAWTSTPIPRLGVPELIVSDGPHGVRRQADVHQMALQSLPATCFPTFASVAAAWDADLIKEMAEALAEEAIALNVDVLLGPGNNMKRTPTCGRNFEYFSEDPYLSGQLAASYINAMQAKGVGVSIKHYAVNNQEYQRFSINVVVDERTLREIYLPSFETAVKQAKPWTVMCSYNKINGTFGSENDYLLTDILKKEWGFEGLVVSDWGAVHDRVAGLKAGMDWEMPGPRPRRTQEVIDAVRSGQLDEAALDESVRRILGIVFKAAQTPKGKTPFDAQAHHALARRISAEGMVLLKNNGILPLKNMHNVAVIGRAAAHPHFQGGGSSHINPTQVDMPIAELQKLMPDAEFIVAEGYPADDSFKQPMIDEAVKVAKTADVAVMYVALPSYKESEGYDRTDIDLTKQQIALIKAVSAAQPKTVVVLNNGSPVAMSEWIDGCAAVLEAWMMGQAGGGSIADVLTGKINPSGRLAETFPLKLSDTPAFLNSPGENGQVRYGEGLYIGYRYYDAKDVPVLFPFGYGLSYTTFAYSAPRVSASAFKDVDGLMVEVDVTNTGAVAGKETVQVYVHDHASSLVRPPKELKGFAKVALEPGQTKTVKIQLDTRAFAFYNPAYKQWITEDGKFDILVGASAADIRGKATVTLHSTQKLPCVLTTESTIREWGTYAQDKPALAKKINEAIMRTAAMFAGSADGESAAIGMNAAEMLLDMPLLNVMEFNEAALAPSTAKEVVDGLLKEAHEG